MRKVFCFLLFTFYTAFSNAQPKLVVGIVIDQMRYDYIDRYWNKFGNHGFKRLVNEGFFCKNTNYNYVPTITAPGHASIYTGATPSVHGIVANDWVDKETKGNVYCVYDHSVNSVGTANSSGKMSPKNLISSTIGEELKKASIHSKVIGIALKDRGAILPAGHTANAAYWYDGTSGNWITSSYYMKELPAWVNNFNRKELAKSYLSQDWTTILPIGQYTESDADDNVCERIFKGKDKPTFPYDLPSLMKTNGGFELIRTTPFGNSFTKDFSIETIKNEALGKDSITDLLCVSFSSTDNIGHYFGPQSVEVEDCYIRLDKDIAELLIFLDEFVGKKEYLFFLTADHGGSEAILCLQKKNIPAGVIHEKVIAESLKKKFSDQYGDSILMAVSGYDVYLNKSKIAEKKLNMEDIQKATVQCLLKMEGIADAITSVDIQNNTFQDSIRSKVKAGFNAKRSGDVIFVLKPNWLSGYNKGASHGSPYRYDTHVPLILFGWNINGGSTSNKIAITDIAPTISHLLGIPKTNGNTGKPIMNFIK